MRISDDRYSRDRLRFDLALRFIRHEARTHTVRDWTGLTDDRIRKLYRTYLRESGGRALARPRGKSPQQTSFFLRTPRMQQETAVLASLCCLLGVVPRRSDAPRALANVPRGELLCQAYEAYRAFVPGAQISFEHAVFLVTALARGDEIELTSCPGCGSLSVLDRLSLRERRCEHCGDPLVGAQRPLSAAARRLPLARLGAAGAHAPSDAHATAESAES